MPRTRMRGWEGHPNYRWTKEIHGVRHRITCDDLGLPRCKWNQDDSLPAARVWFDKLKRAALRAELATDERVDADGVPHNPRRAGLDEVDSRILYAGPDELPGLLAAKKAIEIAPLNCPDEQPLPLADAGAVAENLRLFEMMGGQVPPDLDPTMLSHFFGARQLWQDRVKRTPVTEPGATVGKLLDAWLELQKTRLKPKSVREIIGFVAEWKDLRLAVPDAAARRIGERIVLNAAMPVSRINEDLLADVFQCIITLKYGPVGKRKRWQRFKQWVQWLGELKKIEFPRNLRSRAYSITVPKREPVVPELAAARAVLAALKPRLRLYALLGINCSMNNVDVGNLKKKQIDWKTGRLWKKRVKTEGQNRVPKVHYRLWPETLELLRQHLSKDPEYALTSSTGTPLYSSRMENGKPVGYDLIVQQWGDAKTGITFTQWRDLGANLIYDNERHRPLKVLYLGQAPHGVSDVHYINPKPEILDAALKWLRAQLLPTPKAAK
ncbi:MAG: hypothetical protein ACKODX_06145 [Gemmata sp.]